MACPKEDAKQDIQNGTAEVFIEAAELKHREDDGHFGSLFALVLTQLTLRKAVPLAALKQVEEIAGVKPPGVNFWKHTHTFT